MTPPADQVAQWLLAGDPYSGGRKILRAVGASPRRMGAVGADCACGSFLSARAAKPGGAEGRLKHPRGRCGLALKDRAGLNHRTIFSASCPRLKLRKTVKNLARDAKLHRSGIPGAIVANW